MKGLNLSQFHKVKEDNNTATFRHKNAGHTINIFKGALPAIQRKQIEKLPIQHFDDGTGSVQPLTIEPTTDDAVIPENQNVATDADADQIKQFMQASSGSDPEDNSDAGVTTDASKQALVDQQAATQQDQASEPNNAPMPASVNDMQVSQGNQPVPAPAPTPNSPQDGPPKSLDQQLADSQAQLQNIYKQRVDSENQFQQALKDNKIDPNRLVNNQDTGQKIRSAIGMVLGGIGGALTHQENPAAKKLHDAIDKDVDAQRSDQSNKMNLWKMHNDALGNEEAATLQTKNNLLQMAKLQLDKQLGEAPGPMATLRANAMKSDLDQHIASNTQRATLLQGGTQGAGDPARLAVALIQDPADRKQSLEEIKNATNVSTNGPKIMQAFDDASNDKHTVDLIPGMKSAPQKALHQLLLPNFKTIDGTVRQAAMDETFQNVTPQIGDSSDTISSKRQALTDWMHSESDAPVSRGHGIDLTKFPTTAENIPGQSVDRLLPDGKIGVFDSSTKKFIRYK